MRILILGAGGIGGYFGGRLAEAGIDTTFLVRPARRQQLAHEGLRIESPVGDMRFPVKSVVAEELSRGYDVILFTCKAYDLDSAMDAVAPAMGGDTALLPLLNGMAHFERLDARFGSRNVMGGTAHINVTLRKDGVIVHGDMLQRIVFGERDRSRSERARLLAEAFARTKAEAKLSEDIVQDLWEKVVFLSALAATTCLFRANVGEIMSAPGGREAMERALATNTEIARREGHVPREATVAFARERLTDPKGAWSASMLRDMEAGGRVEADHVIGWMLERARRHGLDDTVLAFAYTHLKAYETRRAARGTPTA
jgi:2-dehydropantoate 2-reductase